MELQEIIKTNKVLSPSVSDSLGNINLISTKTRTLKQVRHIANTLSDKLNNRSRYKYYCKVAWRLPENVIWGNLELALGGKDPQRLFTWLCEQSLSEI